jgi:hypothetical protein
MHPDAPDAPDFQAFDLRNNGVAGTAIVEFIVAIGTDNTGTKVRVLASRFDVTEQHIKRAPRFTRAYEQDCWVEASALPFGYGVYLERDGAFAFTPADLSDLGDALTECDGWKTYTY